jgi:hypothetical protein
MAKEVNRCSRDLFAFVEVTYPEQHCLAWVRTYDLPVSKDGYDQLTDKFTKRKTFVPEKSTWTAHEWGMALMDRLQISDWGPLLGRPFLLPLMGR